LSASEADAEDFGEVMIHLKIWDSIRKRQEREEKKAEWRAKHKPIE